MSARTVFRLEITLGNDAMQTSEDLAHILEFTSRRVRLDGLGWIAAANKRLIADVNGNTVGHFTLTTEEEK